jgi:hypothetical protein
MDEERIQTVYSGFLCEARLPAQVSYRIVVLCKADLQDCTTPVPWYAGSARVCFCSFCFLRETACCVTFEKPGSDAAERCDKYGQVLEEQHSLMVAVAANDCNCVSTCDVTYTRNTRLIIPVGIVLASTAGWVLQGGPCLHRVLMRFVCSHQDADDA